MIIPEEHPILEKIISAVMIIPDMCNFTFDMFTIRLRDKGISRKWKRRFPFLSCRRETIYGLECGPGRRYYHINIIERLCPYYEKTKCRKY